MSYYQEKVNLLKQEVRTKKEQMEFETNQKRLAILEEEVYNTEQSTNAFCGNAPPSLGLPYFPGVDPSVETSLGVGESISLDSVTQWPTSSARGDGHSGFAGVAL